MFVLGPCVSQTVLHLCREIAPFGVGGVSVLSRPVSDADHRVVRVVVVVFAVLAIHGLGQVSRTVSFLTEVDYLLSPAEAQRVVQTQRGRRARFGLPEEEITSS